MYNHLPKILFLIPLYLMSCTTSQLEEEFPQKEEQTAIGFNAKVNSRALADIDDVKTNGFSVWGGYTGGTEAVFNGDLITFGNASSIITDKYWTYNTYNFYAVYPSTTTANVANNTFTINNYNVKNTEDLLCASKTHTYPEDGSTVSLEFKHLLTNISVSFQKSADNKDDEIIVTGVHLIGMKTQGNYTRTTSTEAWTDFQEPFYISVSDLSVPVDDDDNPTLCASDMLVMPQPITENSVAFYITYTYSQQGSSVAAQSKSLTTYLPADISVDNPTWVIGKKVNYIGTIHVDKYIEFSTPKVETWGAEQAGGTIIIK